jgi:hypothetical protein
MATVGDHDQARAFARQISDPDQQAGALARLAVVAMGTSREAAPAAQQRCGNSLPLVAHARQLLGEALVTGSWTEVVAGLARVDPSTVVTLAEQLNNYSLV